jgi:hypothetical protein
MPPSLNPETKHDFETTIANEARRMKTY